MLCTLVSDTERRCVRRQPLSENSARRSRDHWPPCFGIWCKEHHIMSGTHRARGHTVTHCFMNSPPSGTELGGGRTPNVSGGNEQLRFEARFDSRTGYPGIKSQILADTGVTIGTPTVEGWKHPFDEVLQFLGPELQRGATRMTRSSGWWLDPESDDGQVPIRNVRGSGTAAGEGVGGAEPPAR